MYLCIHINASISCTCTCTHKSFYTYVYIYIHTPTPSIHPSIRPSVRPSIHQEPQTDMVAMSQLDLHALVSEVIRGLEDLHSTSLKGLREMLERRLGISSSDRKRESLRYGIMRR